jgi:hypothetical protein
VLGPHATVGHTIPELDFALDGQSAALSLPLAPRQRHSFAPGRGGAIVSNKQLYLLCAVIPFTVSNLFQPALLFGLALFFLTLFLFTET